MAFDVKKFVVFKKVSLPKTQTEKECEVELEGEVNKILTASSGVSLLSQETSDGVLSYMAEISTCVTYITADMRIGSANSICEFSGKIENSLIKNGDKVMLSLTVTESKVGFENGNAYIKNFIQEEVDLIGQKEVKSIDCQDDDVCVKNGSIKLDKFIGYGNRENACEDEFVAKSNVKKVVSLEPSVSIKNTECQNGYVSVTGETMTRIIYLTIEDKFESHYVITPFKDEIEIDGVESGMTCECKPHVRQKGCEAEIIESDKGTKVIVKTPYNLNCYVYNAEEIAVVEDMYSINSEIMMSSESFDMSRVCKSEVIDTKIDGSLTLGEEKPRVDKVIYSGASSILITNSYVSNGELFVEGIAKTTVVYLNDDEGSLNSVEIEIPVAINEKTNARDDAKVCSDAVIYDTDVVVKKGREFFFDGKIRVNVRICEEEISATIVSAQRGEEYPERDCAMQLVYGKEGETLWDIAKRNKVKEEQLLVQNSDVVFPLIQDAGLILFYQKLM